MPDPSQSDAYTRLHAEMAELTCTATDESGIITVTVGQGGEMIDFLLDKGAFSHYRDPQDLADAVNRVYDNAFIELDEITRSRFKEVYGTAWSIDDLAKGQTSFVDLLHKFKPNITAPRKR